MKAIVQDTYASPSVLELRDINRPGIGDDEVLLRVHAAGVDRGVWHLMKGWRMPTSGQPSAHWASRSSCLTLTLLTNLMASTRRGVYGQGVSRLSRLTR